MKCFLFWCCQAYVWNSDFILFIRLKLSKVVGGVDPLWWPGLCDGGSSGVCLCHLVCGCHLLSFFFFLLGYSCLVQFSTMGVRLGSFQGFTQPYVVKYYAFQGKSSPDQDIFPWGQESTHSSPRPVLWIWTRCGSELVFQEAHGWPQRLQFMLQLLMWCWRVCRKIVPLLRYEPLFSKYQDMGNWGWRTKWPWPCASRFYPIHYRA